MFSGRGIVEVLATLALLASPSLSKLDQPLSSKHAGSGKSQLNARRSEFSWEGVLPQKNLVWQDCYSGLQCARFIVPLDYSEPQGREAVIALVRKPALVAAESDSYRGSVLFNPGGPGGSGVDFIILAGEMLATVVGPQFDLIGFDPRAEQDDGYLRHMNTDQTAQDMLRIVEAYRQQKLQYWGFSYGSILGATFAAMFPAQDKIERLVIDGVVDSEDYYATLWTQNLVDADKTMEHFFTGCADASQQGCAFWAPSADEIRQNLSKLYESVRARPVPVRTDTSYGVLDYNLLRVAVFVSLYFPYDLFPTLAQGLAELSAGDGRRLFELVTLPPYQCSCDAAHLFDTVLDASIGIACNDGDDVPGDLQSSQEYFNMMANSSQWGDIWSHNRLDSGGLNSLRTTSKDLLTRTRVTRFSWSGTLQTLSLHYQRQGKCPASSTGPLSSHKIRQGIARSALLPFAHKNISETTSLTAPCRNLGRFASLMASLSILRLK
ncbi:unnamed protein product [Cyclocybe aegerita]|uniref:AB hydrolase-1 domain-containing protein n=1 Tax=Cyclocybe aegerita TaxID=1973307 RepID=A0A8S0XPJ8_CYCAE|nr:unnamed protein product [Cyclocybe aegerita]